MRDKQNPGDTYNYKEHVYADPLALRQEIQTEKQEKASKRTAKKYQKASSPPPVPGGPRKGTTISGGSGLYAELAKKKNVGRPSVRDLGRRFGGTLPRAGGDAPPLDEDSPPPVPAVTESRNFLDGTNSPAPGSPLEGPPNDAALNLNIPADLENESRVGPGNAASNSAEAGKTEDPNANAFGTEEEEEESFGAPSPEPEVTDKAEVIIDVRINSEAGIEIGAEIPTAAGDDADTAPNGDDGGVRLIKSVTRDPLASDAGSDAASPAVNAPAAAPAANSPAPPRPDRGSETGSGGSGSAKRKKKDPESGLRPISHFRRNLIMICLFLFVVLILVSVAVVILANYTQIFQ